MEFGLREYLLVLGCVLIIGLLADGIRRTIKHKRDGLKLDLMTAPPKSPGRSDVSAPRPVRKKNAVELEPDLSSDALFDSDDTSQLNLWASEIKSERMKPAPEQEPYLLEDSEDAATQPLFDTDGGLEAVEKIAVDTSENECEEPLQYDSYDHVNQVTPIDVIPNDDLLDEAHVEDQSIESDLSILAEDPMATMREDAKNPSGFIGSTFARLFGVTKQVSAMLYSDNTVKNTSLSPEEYKEAKGDYDQEIIGSSQTTDDLVVIQICPTRSEQFDNIDLHTACLRAGLRFTKNLIYQRFPFDHGDIPLFSLANGTEPGTFEGPARGMTTPMLFVFAELPGQPDPIFAVNELISGARSIAREIGGDVFSTQGLVISKDWIDLARAMAAHQRLANQ